MVETQPHLLRQLSRADWVTAAAVALAVCAIWVAVNGHRDAAMAMTFFSMYLDYVDGAVARKYGGSPYGAVLDSLYDVIGWVAVPSLIVNMETHWNLLVVAATTIYCVASVLRLARFTVQGYIETSSRHYVGLPVLFSQYPLVITPLFSGYLSAIALLVFVPFMVSSRLVRKPPAASAYIPFTFAVIYCVLAAV